MASKARAKALAADVVKHVGGGSACILTRGQIDAVPVIPTGARTLDEALGVGGWPLGRIVEVYGSDGVGKTTLALHAVAEAQRAGHLAAFVDVEHAMDPRYAEAIGVDLSRLVFSQPDSGEQAFDVLDALTAGGAGLVVVDSVAALVSREELDGSAGDSHVALQARLMSQGLRRLCGRAHVAGTCVWFTNQLRSKIGGFSYQSTTGGNAMKYYASVRVSLKKGDEVKVGSHKIGMGVSATVVKNKLAPPFRTASYDVRFGRGIDVGAALLDAAVEAGVVVKGGAWYAVGEDRIAQGRIRAADALNDSEELRRRIEALLEEAT